MADVNPSDIAIYVAASANLLLIWRIFNGAPKWVEQWIAWRRAKTEERAADWKRLREEIERLSESEKQCRRDYLELHQQHMEVIQRVNALEGYLAGQGRASQEAAGVIALERRDTDDADG